MHIQKIYSSKLHDWTAFRLFELSGRLFGTPRNPPAPGPQKAQKHNKSNYNLIKSQKVKPPGTPRPFFGFCILFVGLCFVFGMIFLLKNANKIERNRNRNSCKRGKIAIKLRERELCCTPIYVT